MYTISKIKRVNDSDFQPLSMDDYSGPIDIKELQNTLKKLSEKRKVPLDEIKVDHEDTTVENKIQKKSKLPFDVSENTWSRIFPYDYDIILYESGRLMMLGAKDNDSAVIQASLSLYNNEMKKIYGDIICKLWEAITGCDMRLSFLRGDKIPDNIIHICNSLQNDVYNCYNNGISFSNRSFHIKKCMVCNEIIVGDGDIIKSSDGIHDHCHHECDSQYLQDVWCQYMKEQVLILKDREAATIKECHLLRKKDDDIQKEDDAYMEEHGFEAWKKWRHL